MQVAGDLGGGGTAAKSVSHQGGGHCSHSRRTETGSSSGQGFVLDSSLRNSASNRAQVVGPLGGGH